jgi:DNA-binding Lrp family transcriptional regulator
VVQCNTKSIRHGIDPSVDIVCISNYIMATSFVLINCEFNSEKDIIEQLKSIDGIEQVYGVFGAYDILAKIESEDIKKIRGTITAKIRKIKKISSTLTLVVIEE